MTYYKVKPGHGGQRANFRYKFDYLVSNELYTAAEINKYSSLSEALKYCDVVTIPKNKIYWFFGARFACKSVDIPAGTTLTVLGHKFTSKN